MVLFYTSHYFDYFTNKAWQFLAALKKRVVFFGILKFPISENTTILELLPVTPDIMLLRAQLHVRMEVNAFLYASWFSCVYLEHNFYRNLHDKYNFFI